MRLKTRTLQELWAEIEREAGPLDQMDLDGLKRALDLASGEAFMRGDEGVEVPLAVAKRMIADSIAQQRGQAIRPAHRPKTNWWQHRWKETACAQFQQRRRALILTGSSPDDATEQAAIDTAPGHFVSPATLISWAKHPGRRKRK